MKIFAKTFVAVVALALSSCGEGGETCSPDDNGREDLEGLAGTYRGSMEMEMVFDGETQTRRFQTYYLQVLTPADDILHLPWGDDCHLEFHLEDEDVYSLIPTECTMSVLDDDDTYLTFDEGEIIVVAAGRIQLSTSGTQQSNFDGFSLQGGVKQFFEGTRTN